MSTKMERAKGEAQIKAPEKVREGGYFPLHREGCKQHHGGCDV